MTEQQRKKTENKIMYLSFGVLGLAVLFLIIVGVTQQAETLLFPIGLSVFLLIYWMIADFLPIKWLKLFEDKTEEQVKAYWIFALLDGASLAGLVYFIIDMDSMLGVLIFAGCTMLKRRFNDTFLGKNDAAEEASEEVETAAPEEASEEIETAAPEEVSEEIETAALEESAEAESEEMEEAD